MKKRNGKFNPKKRIAPATEQNLQLGKKLAELVSYGGNPEHKKNPGDFGLTPPASPRSTKSLCDSVSIFKRAYALYYLKRGLELGFMCDPEDENAWKKGWPKNIWSVTDNGEPLEAQLENCDIGSYHGYPMVHSDPFAVDIVKEWKKRSGK